MFIRMAHITQLLLEPALQDNQPRYTITGRVTEQIMATPCRVRLYERSSGRLVNEIVTDAVGRFSFTYIQPISVYVVAIDKNNVFNAVMQDGLTAAATPDQPNSIDNVLNSTYALNSVINIPITVNGSTNKVVNAHLVFGERFPNGIYISGNTFTGSFTKQGSYSFIIRVLDDLGNYLTRCFDICVSA